MLAASLPTKFPIPFANNAVAANTNAIPQASQIGITAGAASLVDGFPPLTFIPVGAGGIPPWGRDFNGLFNQITAWSRYSNCAGGLTQFDSAFSTAIGGYPYGAVLVATNGVTAGSPQGGAHLWISTVDNNTVNPDATFNSANWVPVPGLITTTVTYTVGGTASQFIDLNAAFAYLTNFTIADTGRVILQYAAGVFNYSSMVYMNHPQNNLISILGAALTGPIDTTGSAYSGSVAASMAYLRSKFTTELHFTGGAGIEVDVVQVGVIDALLITGDGTSAGPFVKDGQGLAFLCGTSSLQIAQGTPQANGLAVCQFVYGLTIIGGGTAMFQFSAPIVLIGNSSGGLVANGRSYGLFRGRVLGSGNTGLGDFYASLNSVLELTGGYFGTPTAVTGGIITTV